VFVISIAVNCTVNVQAYSGQDPCRLRAEGFVRLNGHAIWNASYCARYPNERGVTVIDVDPVSCSTNGIRLFDTWASSSDAADLSAYMQYVRDGAVLVGVSGDEPMQQLSPAQTTLRAAGIFVDDVPYRGNFAFVAQKGFAYKTVTSKGVLDAPARIDIQVTGDVSSPC
jgi:Interleukin-like EMT inducer